MFYEKFARLLKKSATEILKLSHRLYIVNNMMKIDPLCYQILEGW